MILFVLSYVLETFDILNVSRGRIKKACVIQMTFSLHFVYVLSD